MLDEELGIPPQPETEALYQELCQQRVATAPVAPIPHQTQAQRSRYVLIQKMGRFWVEDRLLLWPTRRAPLQYTRLLDCAADCVLLQKVGGGYTFRHRLLQEYFAELG